MHSALLANGKLITAKEYSPSKHGVQIFCMDQGCKAPVIFISSNEHTAAHFKTSGKGESLHSSSCGFFQKLSFQDSVAKVSEYQETFKNNGMPEIVIRMNLNAIDPDYEKKTIERDEKEKKEEQELKIKKDNATPQTLNTLKAVKKLFVGNEPDILASILISIKGSKVPISYLIRDYKSAHKSLWTDDLNQNFPYFVHGTVDKVIRREKVWYINFLVEDGCYFSLVVFERHFKHFTYKDEELIGKDILAYGYLKKNTFSKDRQSTEMLIKSKKYVEFL